MNLRILSIAIASLSLVGCSVMHFQNGPVQAEGRTIEQWHHNVALSLYEVSPPLNMKALCADKPWSMITTQETFATGLAGAAVNSVALGVSVWDPQMVDYTCGK